MAISPSYTVHDQYNTEYVTLKLLLHAAFVAYETWGLMLEPARRLRASVQIWRPRPPVVR